MKHIFIVNPYAGKTMFAENLREKLARIEGLDYFVFNTRYAGYETELVKKIRRYFVDEKLRFYCCGGSGTMRNMLNGFEDLSQAEVAFYPCGLTNDFIKCFHGREKQFYQIEDLINGDVVSIDYIQSNHGAALNTFSTGLDASFVTRLDKYRMASIFGEQLPYVFALLSVLLGSKPQAYDVYIDGVKREGQFSEIVFGNGCTLGGTIQFAQQADLADGKAAYVLVPPKGLLPIVQKFLRRDYNGIEQYAEVGFCETIRLERKDHDPILMNFDGEIIHDVCDWQARIVPKGLKLVVPKGVWPNAE